MTRNKILLAIIVLAVAILFVAPAIVGPILDKKITASLNKKFPDLIIEIDKVRWSLIPSRLTMKKITVHTKPGKTGSMDLTGQIASIQFKGINLLNFLFKNKYEINGVIISNGHLEGKVPFQKKETPPTLSPIDLQIGNILFDQINLAVKDSASAQMLSVKAGMLNIIDLDIEKQDTLGIFAHFDFEALQLISVSSDSLYTYKVSGIVYSDTLKTLSIDSLHISPNYNEYDFTARHPHETDRIEAHFSPIYLNQFSAAQSYNSGNLVISHIDIGKMDMDIFRDKRKADSQKEKPAFQEILYNFAGFLRIDSITMGDGHIFYTEHAEKANEPGQIRLDKFKAKIYNLTNDTIYKTQDTSMIIMAQAMLMGKGKFKVSLKAKLYDPQHTFSMNGSLAEMDVRELNPILERNAFMYANSAKIEKMSFNFRANDTEASGEMTMLYNGLDIAIKNKRTDDTTAVKEQIISLIANKRAWNSNPMPGDEVRVGTIDHKRDPTRSVVSYSIKSIISGIKSSIIKKPKKKKNLLQRIFSSGDEKQKDAKKN